MIGTILVALVFVYAGMALSGLLVKISAFLVNASFLTNLGILNSLTIKAGWLITRDLANLGFVLFIIIIAIATILRLQQYEAKSILGKLIAVALLVNFSLVFAGIFIDFSNMLTRFFLTRGVGEARLGQFANAIMSAYEPQQFLNPGTGQVRICAKKDPQTKECLEYKFETVENKTGFEKVKGLVNDLIKEGGGLLKATTRFLFGPIFTIILNLIASLVLLALAVMLLIRFVALNILLILAPLACLFYILPATKKMWDQWWNQLIKWVIFTPVVSFFLYLAFYLSEREQATIDSIAKQSSQGMNFDASLLQVDSAGMIVRTVLISGFLLGGLIVANSMGITGAKAFLGVAQATGKWARGAIGRAPGWATRRVLSGGTQTVANEITNRGQRIGAALSSVPGFKGIAQRISRISAPAAQAEAVENYRKTNVLHLSNEAFLNQAASNLAFSNPTQAAAFAEEAARRNLTDNQRLVPYLQRYLQTAQRMGNVNKVLNNRPDLAPVVGQTVQQAMQRIRADKADEISHDAFGNPAHGLDVVLNLDNSKIRRLGAVGEQRQKDAIENAINNAINNIHLLTPAQVTALNHAEAQIRTLEAGGNW